MQQIAGAFQAIRAGKLSTTASTIVATHEAVFTNETRRMCCATFHGRVAGLSDDAAEDGVMVARLPESDCTALYVQGFAAVDLGRLDYERLVALAPTNAHVLTEPDHLARAQKDWPRMLATCGRAGEALAMPRRRMS